MSESNQPAYLENYLAHYGVAGMRWGKRKATDSNLNTKKSKTAKPKTKDIVEARDRLHGLADKGNAAIAKRDNARTQSGRDKANAQVEAIAKEYTKTLSVATKRTGAEKVATILGGAAVTLATASVIGRSMNG